MENEGGVKEEGGRDELDELTRALQGFDSEGALSTPGQEEPP